MTGQQEGFVEEFPLFTTTVGCCSGTNSWLFLQRCLWAVWCFCAENSSCLAGGMSIHVSSQMLNPPVLKEWIHCQCDTGGKACADCQRQFISYSWEGEGWSYSYGGVTSEEDPNDRLLTKLFLAKWVYTKPTVNCFPDRIFYLVGITELGRPQKVTVAALWQSFAALVV